MTGGLLPPGPVVKICGLTRLEDVLLARDLGAWALGFVFAPSPRRLTPAAARGLIRGATRAPSAAPGDVPGNAPGDVRPDGSGPHPPLAVGVFVDASIGELARVVAEVGLDGVQLHGPAGPGGDEVRAAVGDRDRRLLIIQAIPVDPDEIDAGALGTAIAEARREADVVLLDTRTSGQFGGTGTAFPWEVARELGDELPLLVAGGIGPENVHAALRQSGAWGVDVSSGVERSPGIKDPATMRRLFVKAGATRHPAADGPVLAVPGATRHPAAAGTDERQEGSDR